jgi:hypothetical protein
LHVKDRSIHHHIRIATENHAGTRLDRSMREPFPQDILPPHLTQRRVLVIIARRL